MGSLRVVLLAAGLVMIVASIVAYYLFSVPKATALLAGSVGLALILFSNAAMMLDK